jgi:hypothetical protein
MINTTNPIIKEAIIGTGLGLITGATLGAIYGRNAHYMFSIFIGATLSLFTNIKEKEIESFAREAQRSGAIKGAKIGALIGIPLGIATRLSLFFQRK